jgi:Fur family zinc uptake transcriptional regulator
MRKSGEVEKLVEGILANASRPLSAYQIADSAAKEGCKIYPAQVYRSVNSLVARGLIRRVESLNAYITGKPGHECLAICRQCGSIAHFDIAELQKELQASFSASSFEVEGLVMEASGICADCKRASN